MIKIYEMEKSQNISMEKIKLRAQSDIENVSKDVRDIISEVRINGDYALVSLTTIWDDPSFTLEKLKITKNDIKEAYIKIERNVLKKLREQISLAKAFHLMQKKRIVEWEEDLKPGIRVGEKWTPIEEVGLYVPGGKNPFPTVALILAVAAKTAGCRRIMACISPKGENNEVIIALNECGVKEIYRVAGAQAIAAMTYGTQSIKPVRLVAGPGNPYVTAAKIICQEKIAIDMPAGPSEAIILADGSITRDINLEKKAGYCAADILARAEHGPDSAGVLVTDSIQLALLTRSQVKKQLEKLSRKKYVKASLNKYSAIIVCKTMERAVDFVNSYAPEHLELLTNMPRNILSKISNAGSVFLGMNNPVAAGDYAIGINHILPTGTWANRSSPVGVWTFMKRMQYSQLLKTGLQRLKPIVQTIADVEGLDGHKRSVEIRFEEDEQICLR